MPVLEAPFAASAPRRPFAGAMAALVLSLLAAAPLGAQQSRNRISPAVPEAAPEAGPSERGTAEEKGEDRRALYAFALRHRRAAEALELVRPLLSSLGTVELQPGHNTVVVRDSLASLSRIVPALRRFDRPGGPLEIEILVVRAGTADLPATARRVPPELERNLRALLRYERYELVAEGRLRGHENQDVTFELGGGYAVRFEVGSVDAGERLKLSGFQIERTGAGDAGNGDDEEPLIHTHLNVQLGRPLTLGLARSETSDSALMVAITCRRGTPPAPAPPVTAAAKKDGG